MKRLSIQRGFSLIELMVAITISLLIFAAVLRLFLDIGRTNDELAKTNEQIENGRFTVQLLQLDLMHAGFWDGTSLTSITLPQAAEQSLTTLPPPALPMEQLGMSTMSTLYLPSQYKFTQASPQDAS